MLAHLGQERSTARRSAQQLIIDDVLDRQERNVVTGADQANGRGLHVLAE